MTYYKYQKHDMFTYFFICTDIRYAYICPRYIDINIIQYPIYATRYFPYVQMS